MNFRPSGSDNLVRSFNLILHLIGHCTVIIPFAVSSTSPPAACSRTRSTCSTWSCRPTSRRATTTARWRDLSWDVFLKEIIEYNGKEVVETCLELKLKMTSDGPKNAFKLRSHQAWKTLHLVTSISFQLEFEKNY